MGCRYFLLLGECAAASRHEASDVAERLLAMGLQERHAGANARLFASPATPTLPLLDGSIAVGHLFDRGGTRIATPTSLPEDSWGEYVLVQAAQSRHDIRIARDPSGGVPCVYSLADGSGFATSDVSIAVQLDLYEKRIDWNFVAHFLAYPYVKTARTGLAGIHELLPGCALHVRNGRTSTSQTWSPWKFVATTRRHSCIGEAAAALRLAVETAVSAWARVDGHALVELSGGLDSSIVACCLRGMHAPPHCATLLPELPGADERLYAGAVASRLGAVLHVEPLPVEASRFDAPVPAWCTTPGIAPLQHAVDGIMDGVASREGMDCLYSGGGGDTVFGFLGGATPAADAILARRPGAGLRAVTDLAGLHQCTYWTAAHATLRALRARHAQPANAQSSLLEPSMLPDTPDPHPWAEGPIDALPGDRERIEGLAGTQLFRDAVPRANHRWLRLPLLSQPVVEACLAVPSWMWITGGRNRAVARLAFADVLPPVVLHRRSKGMFSQYNAAFYNRNKAAMRRFLLEGRLNDRRLLDAQALSDFFERPQVPRDRSYMRIIDLCRTENWLRHQP
jgi:asparagine synthase (glutamine-hydrolysing)